MQAKVSRAGGDHDNAIDFLIASASWGADLVVAAQEGWVDRIVQNRTACCCNSSYSPNYVIIRHANGEYSYYLHLAANSVAVSVGEHVNQGQLIAREGDVGYSCASRWGSCHTRFCDVPGDLDYCCEHLHFEVRNNGNFGGSRLNPRFADVPGEYVYSGIYYTSGNCCADTTPPTTSHTFSGTLGDNGWYISAVQVTLIAQDTGGSGLRATYYRLDGGDWQTYNNPLTVGSDGSYTLEYYSVDNCGNAETPKSAILSVDRNLPFNPTSINPGCSAGNRVWQNSCNDPNFSWSGASDGNGSGVRDYHYYWGPDPYSLPITYTSAAIFDPPAVPDLVAEYYLIMATRDQAGHENAPATAFVLRYDASPPTAAVLINNGALTTTQVNVTLNLSASDTGSGVSQVRVSHNPLDWPPEWQPYSTEIPWTLPALNRRELPVYVQVRDQAGNESAVASDTIYLDLYPAPPHSESYRICGHVFDAAGSRLTSGSYLVHSAVGQPALGSPDSSRYVHDGGFLAGLDGCLPITWTPTLNLTLTQWVVASGGNLRDSTSFRLGDTAGQPAASGAGAFSSPNYVLASGFWAQISTTLPAPPPPVTPLPTAVPPPNPTPGPTSTPPPANFGLQINGGDLYTNDRVVTVAAWAPNVTQMRLSNDNVYQDEGWFAYRITSTWVLSSTGEPLRYVYGWFRDDQSIVYGPYLDTITYDADPPIGAIWVMGGEGPTVTLWLPAYDSLSGVEVMRVSDTVTMTLVPWQPYAEVLSWVLQNPVVYAQYRDRAGNESVVYSSAEGTGVLYRIYLPLVMRND